MIAQLGRNYFGTARGLSVSGGDLLDLAGQNIKKVQHIMGGKSNTGSNVTVFQITT